MKRWGPNSRSGKKVLRLSEGVYILNKVRRISSSWIKLKSTLLQGVAEGI